MGCYNSKVIPAPVADVWAVLRDFHDLSWAKGVVESAEKVGEKASDQVGARRILNGVFHESLVAIDDVERRFSYSIDDGPGTPVAKGSVADYVGSIRAWPVTASDETFVEWSSTWGTSDGGVQEFCDPIYRAALEALATHFGS